MSPELPAPRHSIYASEGRDLHTFDLDPATGALTLVASVTLPQLVQYAVIDPTRGVVYASASDRVATHLVVALRIDPATGALSPHGAPIVPAEGRVIHLDVDGRAEHLALAHPQARRVSTLALRDDGTLGDPVAQPGPTDTGFFAHQARVDPEDRGLVACAMGRDASGDTPEEPGELTAFRYRRGLLTHTARVRLGPGLGPRHLEFAHGRVYVAVERGNRLAVLDYADGVLAATPSFMVATLADPANVRPLQRAGAIRFHPNRRWLYLTNRANATVERPIRGATARVYLGGENDVTLFHVDPASGEPRLAGHFETQGIEPRTFTIDPTGAYLIVANHSTLDAVDTDGRVRAIPRSWVVFRIGDEGRLTLVQKYERFTADLFWVGAAPVRQRDGR